LAVLCILVIFLLGPAEASASALPERDPQTLDEAVQMVRSLEQQGVHRSAISTWLSEVLDRRVTNINSLERMTIPANWLSVFGESAEDKAFREWRDRADFDYRNTAEWTWENRIGQCSEHANTAYYILKQAGVAGNVRILGAPGHEVAVWGIADGADPNDPSSWGTEAWVVDGWLGQALSPAEVQDNKYFKGGTTGDERPIHDQTTSFDRSAPAWQVTHGPIETSTAREPCFVATVAYGTPAAQEVALLRQFREEVLRPRSAGRTFISWYERIGPPLARWVERHDTVRTVLRIALLQPLDLVIRVTRPVWHKPPDPAGKEVPQPRIPRAKSGGGAGDRAAGGAGGGTP
jgi:hypothetical protein